MQIYEVYDGHAGYTYYTIAANADAAIKTVYEHIGPEERRRMLNFHESIIADLKSCGKGQEFPDKLNDEDYLKELEVTDEFPVKEGLVLEPRV